jgi:hypothetical protein
MATKNFQSSSNGESLSNGGQKIQLHPTNHHCLMGTIFFFSHKRKELPQKKVTQKISIKVALAIKIFSCHKGGDRNGTRCGD